MAARRRSSVTTEREPEKARAAPAGALEYLRRQYYDTGLSNNTVALASLALVSLDHVVFGSDWPYVAARPGNDPSEDFERLDATDRAKIDALNAVALVPRLAGPAPREPVRFEHAIAAGRKLAAAQFGRRAGGGRARNPARRSVGRPAWGGVSHRATNEC